MVDTFDKMFITIRREYGEEILTTTKKCLYLNKKLINMTERQRFLKSCKKDDIFPNFILQKGKCFESFKKEHHPFEENVNRIKNCCLKKMLQLEIKICNFSLQKLQGEVSHLFILLRQQFNNVLFHDQFDTLVNKQSTNIRETKKATLDKKFKILIKNQKFISFKYEKNNVINLTEIEIPEECNIVWSFGPNFSFPLKHNQIPIVEILADLENVLSMEDKNLIEEKRAQTTNNITQFLKNKPVISKTEKILIEAQKVTAKFLRENSNLCVTKSDKGNKTVLFYMTDYKRKILELLNDVDTYEILANDPTKQINKKCFKIINDLKNKNLISNQIKLSLKINNPTPPRIYGLPKIHKPNIPLRPIVSTINSPAYNLSKFCCKILNPLTQNSKFNIKSSFVFKDTLSKIKIANDDILASLDVVSLFTNIPLEVAKLAISERWNELEDTCILMKDEFFKILDTCILENNYFKFDNIFYKQKFGLAMGNPLSPILADIVLEKLFKTKLPFLEKQPTFIFKYVDDIILAVTNSNIDKIQNLFNSFHEKLKFTVEKEDNNKSLSFLDLKLHRTSNKIIKTEWYKKEIASNTLLNFISTHPYKMKINVAHSFIKRAIYLTDIEFRQNIIIKIKNILIQNNYPSKLINKLITKTLYTYKCKKPVEKTRYGSMYYVPRLTEKLQKTIKNNSDKLILANKIKNKAFDGYTKLKDRIPDEQKDGLIYKIMCKDCDACYVGETSKTKSERVNQHKKDVENINKYPNASHSLYRSALVKHSFENKHNFDFENSTTLGYEQKKNKRLFKEAVHIWQSNNPVNYKVDTNKLQANYKNIIKNYT